MDKERIKRDIYDGAVIRIGAALESFLHKHIVGDATMGEKIKKFSEQCSGVNRAEVKNLMGKIWGERNRAAHNTRAPEESAFNFKMFQKVRKNLIKLDNLLSDENAQTVGAKKIMLMRAEDQLYTMGNAGDFIKHKMLILLLEWLGENREKTHYADPFGGNPWSKLNNGEIIRRLNASSMHDAWDNTDNKYYGSGQIALNKGASVWVSDKDMHRRSDLEASGLTLLDEEFKDYNNQNGYCILTPNFAGQFDLILIDPLGDFMKERFDELENAVQAVKKNSRLFVMFFVLDMPGVFANHEKFMEKHEEIKEFSCSLRCPKIENKYGIKGESRHEYEILMMSQELKNNGTDNLRKNLREFAKHATEVLPIKKEEGEKVKFWDGKNE